MGRSERRPRDPMNSMTRDSNAVRSTRQICKCFSESKYCADSLSVCPGHLRVYTHSYERAHVKAPVVHVRLRWIMETQKQPACTCTPEDGMWLPSSGWGIKNRSHTPPLLWRNAERKTGKKPLVCFDVVGYPSGTEWLSARCGSPGECTETKDECFGGTCLCTPGYYYSVGNNTCVDCELLLQQHGVQGWLE